MTLDAGAKAPGEWLAGFFCGPRLGAGSADARCSHFGFSDAVSLIQREPCYSHRQNLEPGQKTGGSWLARFTRESRLAPGFFASGGTYILSRQRPPRVNRAVTRQRPRWG